MVVFVTGWRARLVNDGSCGFSGLARLRGVKSVGCRHGGSACFEGQR